jgi:putative Holliday junction resolvase
MAAGSPTGWLQGDKELETQPRYLGLDVGNRRIGVAVSDELGLTAQPVMTLERRRNAPAR